MLRALAAAVLALALVGCAEAEPTESGSESKSRARAAAAKGPKITGTGYTYKVPKGWGRPRQEVPGFDFDSFALDLRDRDGFADNINVLISPAGAVELGEAEDAAERELTAVGARRISVEERVTVAGSRAAHLSAVMSMNRRAYAIEQFYPTEGDQTFVVTFSFSRSVTPRGRARVTDAVLASWAWTD